VITTVLIVFILLSLALHAATIGALLRVRSTINRQLDLSATQLAQVRQQKVRYNFPIDQTFPIDTTIAISETVDVPLTIQVPINQTISLPIETPAGTFNFDVPLNLTVPVSDTVSIPINKQIPFKTDIPIRTEIPIDIDLSEPPLGDILQQFEDALQELRARF
jgi:type II secretory pathway pseudopilin PulG